MAALGEADVTAFHRVTVVIPVFRGEATLSPLIDEIAPLTMPNRSPDGNVFRVSEVLLVDDHGPDRSDVVIRELATRHDVVRSIWLSRNFGQHAATLAGMASSSGDWIVTMDEDGQHDPADIGRLLDAAVSTRSQVVYAAPVNRPPHERWRNLSSRAVKWVFARLVSGGDAVAFQSYRMILGEVGRSVAAYAGTGVFLDVALGWVSGSTTSCPVTLRAAPGRRSGYSFGRLVQHFWRMVLSSGNRPLRLVSALGTLFALGGIGFAIYLVVAHIASGATPQGWTSTMVVILVATGAILFSLGVIAEYLGVAVSMAMGRPPYLIVGDPEDGPLGPRDPRAT